MPEEPSVELKLENLETHVPRALRTANKLTGEAPIGPSYEPRALSVARLRRSLPVLALVVAHLVACDCRYCPIKSRTSILLRDGHGRPIRAVDVGDTLVVGIEGAPSNQSLRVVLSDEETNREVSYLQLTTDAKGRIPPAVLWYHTGVVDARTPERRKLHPYEFATFEASERFLRSRKLSIRVEGPNGERLREQALAVESAPPRRPQAYFSTSDGRLRNGYEEGRDEQMFLTVRNLGSARELQIILVPNRYGWAERTPLRDVREAHRESFQTVSVPTRGASVTVPLGSTRGLPRGAYDVVLRLEPDRERYLLQSDLVTYALDSGILFQGPFVPPWGANDFDIAGRPDKGSGYPYFEFHDVFDLGETMWGAVDPATLPASHPSGRYAAYHVIPHGTAAAGLGDVTEALEVVPIKTGCINANMVPIWHDPDLEGPYDVVVDFGATTATSLDAWQADGSFDAAVDFIDRSIETGAYVVRDPAESGPHPVAYSYGPTSADAADPLRTDVSEYFNSPDDRVSETMDKVPLRAVGHYPTGDPGPWPLVLVLHGNASPTKESDQGYAYLTRLLASHGMIAMSVDQNFLNGGVRGEMAARAVVLLRHLQRWRTWNALAGHPFHGKVDLAKIGLVGHSRGGEAITVAQRFNTALHDPSDADHEFGFSIQALYAFAPVDGQIKNRFANVTIAVDDAHYFIMQGSHDGDVFTFGGQKTYDRAFPSPASNELSKGLVFVHGANHNYWNDKWKSSNDADAITSSLPQISDTLQQEIGKAYLSAFLQRTLQGQEAYRALLTGDVTFGSLPADVTRVHQYAESDRIDLDHYEEDSDPATASYAGATNSASNLGTLLDTDITGTWDHRCGNYALDNPYFLWNESRGLVVGWTSPGVYEISLPGTLGALAASHPYLSLRIAPIYEDDPSALNSAGTDQDLSTQLERGTTPTHALKLSNFDTLPYPVATQHTRKCYASGRPPWQVTGDATKSIMKTVRIPLRSFVVNRADWSLADVSRIRLSFDQLPTGLVAIDDIHLSK